jgi:hypothetical protein
MVAGGVILIHDYFCHPFKGVKAAVRDWMVESKGYKLLPIGDRISVAIHF